MVGKKEVRLDPFEIAVYAASLWAVYLVFKFLSHQIHDPDTWWQLAAGRWMLEHGALTRTEMLTHTLNGTPWINNKWLSHLIMAKTVQWGGIEALYSLKRILGLAPLVLLFFLFRQFRLRKEWILLFLWFSFLALEVRLCTRVELISMTMMALFVLIVFYRPPWMPWALAGLMVLWVNMHIGFIFGLALLALFCLGARWGGEPNKFSRLLEDSLILCTIATVINPYGVKIYSVLGKVSSDFKDAPGLIDEWAASSFQTTPVFWVLYSIAFVVVVLALLNRQKSLRLLLPATVFFLVWGSFSMRNTIYSVFVAVPFIALALIKIQPLQKIQGRSWSRWVVLALCVGLFWKESRALQGHFPRNVVDESQFPRAACQFIKENRIQGPLFNTYGFGGMAAWELAPTMPIFMYGEYLFYPLLAEYSELLNRKSGPELPLAWKDYFDKYKIEVALVDNPPIRLLRPGDTLLPHESVINTMFPQEQWALVFWDDVSLVFVRRAGVNQALGLQEYKVVRPYDMEKMMFLFSKGIIQKHQILEELLRHNSEKGGTRTAAEIAALFRDK